MGKAWKRGKRSAGRHVQLPEWLQASEAWASLKPGPRALYVELKRRFNGAIFFSHREAARALNVTRNTATAYFLELEARGFVRMTQAPHLGPSGIGQASHWALEEVPMPSGQPAGKAFMRCRPEQKPRAKNGTPRPINQDGRALLRAVL